MVKKIIIAIKIFICISCTRILAQDLRSGEISFQHVSGYTYKADLYLYQDSVKYTNRIIRLYWGDSTIPDTLQGGIGGCVVHNGVIVSHYIGNHTYSGTGNYTISYIDSFLISGITNISGSSIKKLSFIDTLIISSFWGANSSPTLFNCQDVKWNCCNWIHNPGATDPDGDSLSYSLTPWTTSNYSFPPATINSITGNLTMSPASIGIYAVAIQINEWRKYNNLYYKIGNTTRYMLLNVASLTSVNELNFSSSFTIYPNPTRSELNIAASDNKKYTCSIKNILGQTFMEKSFVGNISFDVSEWARGMLFVELKDEKGRTRTEKLVVE